MVVESSRAYLRPVLRKEGELISLKWKKFSRWLDWEFGKIGKCSTLRNVTHKVLSPLMSELFGAAIAT